MKKIIYFIILVLSINCLALTSDQITAARAKSSYGLPNVAYSAINTSDIDDFDIVCLNGATYAKDIARNAVVFIIPQNGFGLIYLGGGLNKSKMSCWFQLSVETSGTTFAVFNRAEYDANTFIEGLIQPDLSQLMLEKVYPPNVDIPLIRDPHFIIMPFQITAFETYFDLDNNVCCAKKTNSPTESAGIVSSSIGTFPQTVFNNMMIGFQNTGLTTQTAIIYLPVIVTTN